MATFSTWAALRTAIKDAIADRVAGEPCVGEFRKGNRSLRYNSFEDLVGLYEKTYQLEALESSGDLSHAVSYGRPRRFS